jgi:hypothetical protein
MRAEFPLNFNRDFELQVKDIIMNTLSISVSVPGLVVLFAVSIGSTTASLANFLASPGRASLSP